MRKITCINDNWVFTKCGTAEAVNLPHTWNAQDGQDGGDDYFRGVCVYEKKLSYVPAHGNRLFLQFNGAASEAEVTVNGCFLGRHEGGYSTFRFDVTDVWKPDSVITVAVSNVPNESVYPQKADFTFYGGIYRDVSLIEVPESHFALADNGTPGISVTTEVNLFDCSAVVTVKTWQNAEHVTITVNSESKIATSENGAAQTQFRIENVRLWDGLNDPYLYTASAQLVSGDEICTHFGCRCFSVDAEKGFFLNGRPYPLRGVARHQDRKDVGNAVTREMMEEDMAILLDIGATAVRLSHYQHDQYFYDLCDKNGIIVWAEIPYITKHMPEGNKNTESQFRELITQCRNHPSIVTWALSNEICVAGVTDDLLENHRRLNKIAKSLDPTRPTSIADAYMLEPENPINDIPDLIAYNLYFGWYSGELQDNDTFFDVFHEKYPDRPVGLAEYGADCRYNLEAPQPECGDYSEQYQCLYHEHLAKMIDERPWMWVSFVWNLFDFGADGRAEAEDPGVNHKGLVTFDRKIKKDAFYLYKAYWSKQPFVYITGRRYVDRAEDLTEIKVYSNFNEVSLFVDGAKFATKAGSKVFSFKVPIKGVHQIIARSGECTDEVTVRKVEKPNNAYCLKSSGVRNWFDQPGMEVIPGYFSVKDRMEDIRKVPEGKRLVEEAVSTARAARGAVAQTVKRTEMMERMLYRNTLEGLIRQAGGAITEEMALELNAKLRTIKKPEKEDVL